MLLDKYFWALLALCVVGALIFIVNMVTNSDIVVVELSYGNGVSMVWFGVISLVLALLMTFMIFKPYKIDRNSGGNNVLFCLFFYLFAYIFWSTALFHSRVDRGLATTSGFLLLTATVWLGWVCYHFVEWSIFIFLILLAWCIFLQQYTANVDLHKWSSISI